VEVHREVRGGAGVGRAELGGLAPRPPETACITHAQLLRRPAAARQKAPATAEGAAHHVEAELDPYCERRCGGARKDWRLEHLTRHS
jgi:hypothetical protein